MLPIESILPIEVRRDFVLVDALREAHKKKFDPRKYLRVSCTSRFHFLVHGTCCFITMTLYIYSMHSLPYSNVITVSFALCRLLLLVKVLWIMGGLRENFFVYLQRKLLRRISRVLMRIAGFLITM